MVVFSPELFSIQNYGGVTRCMMTRGCVRFSRMPIFNNSVTWSAKAPKLRSRAIQFS